MEEFRLQLIEMLLKYLEYATGNAATPDDVANIAPVAAVVEKLTL